MQFRLVTYNIHKGIGGIDRRYRPDRIVDTLAHYQPDIVFLQEVDDGVPRSRHHRQVDLLGDALGFPYRAFQANVRLREGTYGNAILSRFPLSDVRDIELTIPLKKRRRALTAHCRLRDDDHSRSVVLINCHLGLAEFERRIQLRRLIDSELLRHVHSHTAVVAAGDLNDVWGGLGRATLEPAGFLSATGPLHTFPAFLPFRALDRIYYRGRLKLHHSYVSRTRIARQASDHLPLVAEFELET
ncbi:MAG: endonuclease/exonuclease/phosphatase family protein [Pirellulales bacterium]